MSEMTSSETSDQTPQSNYRTWPWGQFGWFFVGIGFSFIGLGDAGSILGFIDLPMREVLQVVGTLLILPAIGCSLPAVVMRQMAKRRGERVTHWPWLRRVNFVLLAVLISAQMLSLIIPAMHAARVAQQRAVAAGPWRDHAFLDGSFQVSTPANWELFPDPDMPSSGVRFIDRQNDLHLIASLVSKQDLAVQTLAEFSQLSTQTFGKDAKDVAVGAMQMTEVDGCQAVDQAVAVTFNGVNFCFYLRHVEYPDAWVELRLWSTRSRFEAHETDFAKIAASIRRKQ